MEGGEARIVAYTKVFAIRARLDKRVRYITDGEKTSLASSITYISNPEKTEQFFFTSALNCSSVDTALSEMMETKQQFGKMGGVLGYHFIQSFQPGEVTPEQAHAIGLEFAKRLFGKRYEVVISTHLNKHHLHNHLVVNSVSCVDGQKYSTIEAAASGNVDAINAVLKHYERYIAALATRTLYDENGVPHLCLDEEKVCRMRTKLITKILDFKVNKTA